MAEQGEINTKRETVLMGTLGGLGIAAGVSLAQKTEFANLPQTVEMSLYPFLGTMVGLTAGVATERLISRAAKIRGNAAEVVERVAWRSALVIFGLGAAVAMGGYFIGGNFAENSMNGSYIYGAATCFGAAVGLGIGILLYKTVPTLRKELEAVNSFKL